MDNLKTAIAELKKEQKDITAALEALYTECGEAQFIHASKTDESIHWIEPKDFEIWKNTREQRIYDADTIVNIKTAQVRQNELKIFLSEVDKLLKEQERNYEKSKKKFLLLFFHAYAGQGLSCLTEIEEQLAPSKEVLEKLYEEQQLYEAEKMQASFLKKIALASQLTALKGRMSAAQKKMDEQILHFSESLLADHVLEEMNTLGSFVPDVSVSYTIYVENKDKYSETAKRKQVLSDEQLELADRLSTYGVKSTPQKRIAELTAEIKQADSTITAAGRTQGCRYADMFYTTEGTLKDTALSDEMPELFKTYLDGIAAHRMKLEKNRIHTVYLENEFAADKELHKIAALTKAIGGYKDGILQYERMIKQAEKEISAAEQRHTALQEQNNLLRPQFS